MPVSLAESAAGARAVQHGNDNAKHGENLRQRPEGHAAGQVEMAIKFVSVSTRAKQQANSRQPAIPKIPCELCRITAAIGNTQWYS